MNTEPDLIDAVRAACAAVRTGAWKPQLAVLEDAVAGGVRVAAVPLAEISALRGDWARVAELTEVSLAGWPEPLYAGNVMHAQARLLLRAGTRLADPAGIAATYAALLAAAEPPLRGPMESLAPVAAALAGGEPVVLRMETSTEQSAKDLPHPDSAAVLAAVTAATASTQLRNALTRKRFQLALAIRERVPEVGCDDLFPVLALAAWQVRGGAAEQAWALVAEHLPRWVVVDAFTVAPVDLVIDDDLAALMTPQRGTEVLDTPRGDAQGGDRR